MEWISIKDTFPEKSDRYLVTDGEDFGIMIFEYYKDSPQWSSYNCHTIDVTHWMALPLLPGKD